MELSHNFVFGKIKADSVPSLVYVNLGPGLLNASVTLIITTLTGCWPLAPRVHNPCAKVFCTDSALLLCLFLFDELCLRNIHVRTSTIVPPHLCMCSKTFGPSF